MDVFLLILIRDLRLSFRRWNELATPLLFFIIIASLFPLASSPEISQLRDYGGCCSMDLSAVILFVSIVMAYSV